MNEKLQFLSWCWRKLLEALFQRTGFISKKLAAFRKSIRNDPVATLVLWFLITLLVGIVTAGITVIITNNSKDVLIAIGTVATLSTTLLATSIVKVLYEVFKDDQQNLIDVLRKDAN